LTGLSKAFGAVLIVVVFEAWGFARDRVNTCLRRYDGGSDKSRVSGEDKRIKNGA